MTKISENVLAMPQSLRIPRLFDACIDSVYQALLFPPLREARASPYAGKRGTGDEASYGHAHYLIQGRQKRSGWSGYGLTNIIHEKGRGH